MPATLATPSPLEAVCLVVGIVKSAASLQRFLIGQIKLTRIHVLPVFLPGVRVKRDSGASLYNVERSGRGAFAGTTQPNFVSLLLRRSVCLEFGDLDHRCGDHQGSPKEVVEPDGIEPTTSCLQSRRSPS
jgi:hypothetical protein